MCKEIEQVQGKAELVNQEQSSLSKIIELAVSKGDLAQVEKLLELKERHEKNDARKDYHCAMAEFKKNPPKINKDKTVSYGNTKYNHASLANVAEKVNAELSKHGLSASWSTKQNGAIIVTCKITHIKGHSEETTLSAGADESGSKNSIQAIGSTITYLQRYTLLALTGLATCEDDDGNKAGGAVCITEAQGNTILDLVNTTKAGLDKFLVYMGVKELKEISQADFNKAISAINLTIDAEKKETKK